MEDIGDDFADEQPETPKPEERERFEQLIREIQARCHAAGLQIDADHETVSDFDASYDIHFPAGRGERIITIWDLDDAETLLSQKFEHVRFLENYAAGFSTRTGTLFASVSSIGPARSLRTGVPHRGRILQQISQGQSGKQENPQIELRPDLPDDRHAIVLCRPTKFETLITRGFNKLWLRVRGFNISQHDEAQATLEKISDNLFLQIESETGVVLTLDRLRQMRAFKRLETRPLVPSYIFPHTEYSRNAMTFYWYAASATQMPLMQYLAYYQSLEFFFPIYAQSAAKRAVQSVLRSPAFRADRDSDVARLVNASKIYFGRASANERTQLEATLRECIRADELKEFLTSNPEQMEFFLRGRQLRARKLSLNSESTDLIKEVGERVYQIRCRVVHAKLNEAEEEDAPLLPYTEEEECLYFDIGLIKFLAFRVITASGSTFRYDP